jgi:adenylate cyclase
VAEDQGTRRLAAILAADVAGYTRLMRDDEQATIAALEACRAVFADAIVSHGGRVVDMAGDSVLAVFETAGGAVEGALAIQASLAAREEPEERRMRYRIGVNSGDIVEKADGTVYGDGVNVAARLEGLAEPGHVCVSGSVYDSVEGHLDAGFAYLGEQSVKNVDKPVRAYRVLEPGAEAPRASRRRYMIAAAALVVLVAAGLGVRWLTYVPPYSDMVTVTGMYTNDPVLAAPTGPAIAVLPFDDLSEGTGQGFFADGLTEDIITGLSRFSNLRVIARHSTFQYKGQAVDVREVGEALGVRYVLEGSVRRAGESLRVTAQLLDARDGTHLWADNYARDLTTADIFAVQDSIMERIVGTLGGEGGLISRAGLAETEARQTDNLTAYECVLRAYAYYDLITPEEHLAVRVCLEDAVVRDPSYAEAWGWLADIYQDEYKFAFNTRPEADDPLARAIAASQKAIKADATSQKGYETLASGHYFSGDMEQFRTAAERALSLNPNNSDTLAWLGFLIAYAGAWDRGIALLDKAVNLNPNHPTWYHTAYALRHFRDGNYEAALLSAKRYNIPDFYWHHLTLAIIYPQLGRLDEARAAVGELTALYPGYADVARADLEKWFKDEALVAAMLAGLEKAGLFDEPEVTRPAIAVLPFANLSGDASQAYFADGITEELTAALARFQGLSVTARTSTLQYKETAADAREIGAALGVNYLLEGSIRRDADTVRITAQLIDTGDGSHLWTETYERDLSAAGIFAVQDDIASQIAAALAGNYGVLMERDTTEARRKPPERLESYDCVLLAKVFWEHAPLEEFPALLDCLENAVAVEPDYVDGWVWLSEAYTTAYDWALDMRPDPLALALSAAERAVALAPRRHDAHAKKAIAHFFLHEVEAFLAEAEITLSLNPNDPTVLVDMGAFMAYVGEWERGIALVKRAMMLQPDHPTWWYYPTFHDHFRNGRYETALAEALKVDLEDYHWTHVNRAIAYARLGRMAEARASAARAAEVYPGFSTEALRAELRKFNNQEPLIEDVLSALRLAGMPETPPTQARPVIVVLPFDNMGGDESQDYFADGIAEDITTRLSRFSDLAVIARNSAFQYKGHAVDVAAVAAELGADYVVEGSVRRSQDRVRVTAQLLEAGAATHMWAESYDRDLTAGDVFDIQDEITDSIVGVIAGVHGVIARSAATEVVQRPASLDSYDCVLRVYAYERQFSAENYWAARKCLEEVLAREPNYVEAVAAYAMIATDGYTMGWDLSDDERQAMLPEALAAGQRAIELAPDNPRSHLFFAYAKAAAGNRLDFHAHANRALALNPNDADVLGNVGGMMAFSGEYDRGLELIEKGIALNPYHPEWWYYGVTAAHWSNGRRDEAAAAISRVNQPDLFWTHFWRVIVFTELSDDVNAKAALADLERTYPGFSIETYRIKEAPPFLPTQEYLERAIAALRKAGVPEGEPAE